MPTLHEGPGVVYSTQEATVIDTREMPWEPFEGLQGGSVKVLSRFETGEPEVMLIWRPPGPTKTLAKLPHRHRHPRIREQFFFLRGELPHWDYRSEDDADGELIVFKEGYYLDRRPGMGIHGLEEAPVSPVGTLILHWRSGTGNMGGEPNFDEESIPVPYPADKQRINSTPLTARRDGSGIVYETEGATVIDTREMAWQQFPNWGDANIKVLSRFGNGEAEVMIFHRPGDAARMAKNLPYRHYHPNIRELFFFLDGELPHYDYQSPEQRAGEGTLINFKAGYYLDRRPGAGGLHGLEREPTSATGSVILHWRTGVGNLRGEPNFEQESVEVPYPA
jgi:hypothetical protein